MDNQISNTILSFIQEYKTAHGYEPEKMEIFKSTGILRYNIDKVMVELEKSGEVEVLKPKRSSQYRLK